MKPCTRCKIPKELSEYSKDKSKKDGHRPDCRACRSIQKSSYYTQNKEKIKSKVNEYRQTPAGKSTRARTHAKYPNSRKASIIFMHARRDGKVTRPIFCSECPSSYKIEGHHDDYNLPLEVRWLCSKCHRIWHKNNTPLNR